jgi:hypothetical protein
VARFADLPLLEVGHTITMIGALYEGHGKAFALLFPDCSDEAGQWFPPHLMQMTLEDWQAFLLQTDTLPVEAFPDGSPAKAILRKASREVDTIVSWAVYRRDRYQCRYCGRNDVPLTVDHVIRWEERGPWTQENLVTACRKCNKTRGDMPYADWLQSEAYLRFSDQRPAEASAANEALLSTLESIPLVKRIRSR